MEILPPEYLWLQPIIVASIAVFFVSWIANAIFSANDFLNALLTAIIFGLIFTGLTYSGMGNIEISIDQPNVNAESTTPGTLNSN